MNHSKPTNGHKPMKYRIVEYRRTNRTFKYYVQRQISILGIKFWRTFEWSNHWEVANDYIVTHKHNAAMKEIKVIHDIE
jgi:hypothetical protein